MRDSLDIRHRRSLRLKGYDYSLEGAYFVTICAHGKACLFGDVIGDEMKVNELGRNVQAVWNDLPVHYPHVATDAFVVMPNHVHGVIVIRAGGCEAAGYPMAHVVNFSPDHAERRAGLKPAPTARHGLSEIIRGFKTFSARRVNEFRESTGTSLWQRNYYDHIIRNDADYNRIAEYIANNPQRWAEDSLHPAFTQSS
ncbi:MAG: transposase [Gallionella sp.]|nr:transposase [Gallionella sp.]